MPAASAGTHGQLAAWILLGCTLCGALLTVTAVVRGRRLGWGNPLWFLFGWLTSELAVFHMLASALVVAGFALAGALGSSPGQWSLVIVGLSWGGLLFAQLRAIPTPRILEHSLTQALGVHYRDFIPPPRRAALDERVSLAQLARPFSLRSDDVEWLLRDIPYGGGHERHTLDIYRPAQPVTRAPVLLQIHGGGWVFGNKHEQALPLIYHMAARGWVVVAINYRLSPGFRFPAHLIDCKRALAWIRENIASHGGDPGYVAVTGGSAGGHLAALLALTANRRDLQPGFEHADTRVAACVPFYGVYDFADRNDLRHDGGKMTRWLARHVMERPLVEDPAAWDLASPVAQVSVGAPPFFVLHGTHDSLSVVEEARVFVAKLRGVSRNPVAYAELPGAQHAWEIFRSVRAVHTVHAVARFLEWAHATRR